MRFEKGHKEQTRQRIVETASRRFRKEGVEAVGIAGLMADAGLTHGGFYAHFASKEELVRAALEDGGEQNRARREAALEPYPPGPVRLEALIRYYLRPAHRDSAENGCTIAALIAEVARREDETRATLSTRITNYIEQIALNLPEAKPQEARIRLATAIFGTLLGTLQMARGVTDKEEADRILESGIEAALILARS